MTSGRCWIVDHRDVNNCGFTASDGVFECGQEVIGGCQLDAGCAIGARDIGIGRAMLGIGRSAW